MRRLSALKENNTLSDVDKRESYIKVLIFKINYKVKGTSLIYTKSDVEVKML